RARRQLRQIHLTEVVVVRQVDLLQHRRSLRESYGRYHQPNPQHSPHLSSVRASSIDFSSKLMPSSVSFSSIIRGGINLMPLAPHSSSSNPFWKARWTTFAANAFAGVL